MLLPIFILMMVLAPVLVPAAVTAFHYITGTARNSTQDRVAANFPRRTMSPLRAVPAAA
jgi:hypothetical protein